jgi:hypothetical protein
MIGRLGSGGKVFGSYLLGLRIYLAAVRSTALFPNIEHQRGAAHRR